VLDRPIWLDHVAAGTTRRPCSSKSNTATLATTDGEVLSQPHSRRESASASVLW